MKNKGFTLIELLAVIIILGILMLIAIPSVTSYINNSRKSTYINTVEQLVKGTITKVISGDLEISDTDTTYYVPCTCIKLENGEAKSPYGKFDPAYVVVTFDGKKYNYYFTGKDVQNMGVPTITKTELLSKESIVANVDAIDTGVGIEGTINISIYNDDCSEFETKPVDTTVSIDHPEDPDEPEDPSGSATFDTGSNVSVKMKTLAGDSNPSKISVNKSIIKILRSKTEPSSDNMQPDNLVSTSDSENPIYMWFDDGIIYWWCVSKKPKLNSDASYMFAELELLEELDVSVFDSSEVIDACSLFYSDRKLSVIDVSKWNTSKMVNIKWMFSRCNSLAELDVSKWNVSNVTNMWCAFADMGITTLDVSKWNTSKVTDMHGIFAENSNLTTLDLNNWDVSKVKDMAHAFDSCRKLTTLKISNWNTSSVTSMRYMFFLCATLDNLDVSKWNVSNVLDMYALFEYCYKLSSLDLSKWDTSKVIDMGYMFAGIGAKRIDVSNFDTSKVQYMGYMFYDSSVLEVIDISGFDLSSATDINGMFSYSKKITTIYATDSFETTMRTNVSSYGMFYYYQASYEADPLLVGGAGTVYDYSNPQDKTYARIDGGTSAPGYFTLKT